MMTGRLADPSRPIACSIDAAGGLISGGVSRPSGPDASLLAGGKGLHLVGEDQVRGALLEDRVLAGEGHQLGVLGGLEHRLGPAGDLSERGMEIDFLECSRPEDLCVDLTGQRQHGRAVDVRVPQPGQKVGRARPGDRQARRRPAGQLAVSGRCERRGALVADADVRQLPRLFPAPQRVGEPEVRVPDHPEDVAHAPVDHRLGHHVADRADVLGLRLDADVDAVVSDLDRERRHAVAERRAAVQRAVVIPVPRAAEHSFLDRPLPERASLVRAAVAERGIAPVVVRHGKAVRAGRHRLHAPFREFVQGEHAMPAQRPIRCGRHHR